MSSQWQNFLRNLGEWRGSFASLDTAGAVLDTMELQNDESFVRRGIMQEMDHPSYEKKLKMSAWPVRVNGKPPKIHASPALGQHTSDVLSGWLGLDAGAIAGLKGKGVV